MGQAKQVTARAHHQRGHRLYPSIAVIRQKDEAKLWWTPLSCGWASLKERKAWLFMR